MCHMCRAQTLRLAFNQIGDAGVTVLANACAGGALASCTMLVLAMNQIGDAGTEAFSGALAKGAMAHLTVS